MMYQWPEVSNLTIWYICYKHDWSHELVLTLICSYGHIILCCIAFHHWWTKDVLNPQSPIGHILWCKALGRGPFETPSPLICIIFISDAHIWYLHCKICVGLHPPFPICYLNLYQMPNIKTSSSYMDTLPLCNWNILCYIVKKESTTITVLQHWIL